MKRQNLFIIAILAAGGFGIVYATNGSIITGDLTVTGTCTGCGGGEGNFATYTLSYNNTVAGTAGWPGEGLSIGTDGSIVATDNHGYNVVVLVDGTVVNVVISNSFSVMDTQTIVASSSNGKYKVLMDNTHSALKVYKDGSFLQDIGINLADWEGGNFSKVTVDVSSDGKYIALYGSDNSAGVNRLEIFVGA